MIYQQESDFAQKLKNAQPQGVYFLYGEQKYLIRLYTKKIIGKTVEGPFGDFNLNRFQGGASLDEIADAVEALPMMAQCKCVTVSDLDVAKLGSSDAAKLAQLLESPPETTVLVFTAGGLAVDEKKNAKWRGFIKQVDQVGHVIRLGDRSAGDMNRFLKALAERGGCRISSESCGLLVQRCGADMQVLQNEMEKLCAYRAGNEITREDIRLCTAARLDASVFDLSKLIFKGDYQGAMHSLEDLLYLREEPVAILGVLSGSFIDLYRARIARENGRTAADLCGLFKGYKGREWKVRSALRDCERYTRGQLAQALELLARADFRMKSSRADQAVVLQETVTRLFALRAGGRGAL